MTQPTNPRFAQTNSNSIWYIWLEELHTRIGIVLHDLCSSFKFLPQYFYAIFVNHSTQIVRSLEWILYADQMTVVSNPPSPVFDSLAVNMKEIGQSNGVKPQINTANFKILQAV